MDDFAVKPKTWFEENPVSRKVLIKQAWGDTVSVPDVSPSHKDLGKFLAAVEFLPYASYGELGFNSGYVDVSLEAAIAEASGKYSEMLAKGHFAYRAPGTGLTGMHIFFPFNKPESYMDWRLGRDGFAAASGRPWNQFLDSLQRDM